MNILLLGPQGSGKGTQAKRIAQDLGVPHIATGDISVGPWPTDRLGRRVQPIYDAGDLVPDDLMVELIRERLDGEDGFVLDGFPRTIAQAEALDACSSAIGKALDVVVLLEVDDEVATDRSARPCARGGPGRRHAGGDREAARPVPRDDRAGGGVLSRGR